MAGKGGDPQGLLGAAFKSSTMEKGESHCAQLFHTGKDRGRGHQGGQEAPTPGRARGGVTGEVALRWGCAQG